MVCEKICNSVIALSLNVQSVKAYVTKINPPVQGDVEKVSVEIEKKRPN